MKVDWPRLRDQALVAVCGVVLLWAASQVLGHVLRILVLILLATVLAYALEPPLSLAQRAVPRLYAALGLYALVFGAVATLIFLFGHQLGSEATSLTKQLPGYLDQTGVRAHAVAAGLGVPLGPPQSVSGQL